MLGRILRAALRHQALVTITLVAALVVNLLVIVRVAPAAASSGDLPVASRCQGGGPGCAEQPMIPPPSGGLPHFDESPAPVYGLPALIVASTPSEPPDGRAARIEHPPKAAAI